MSFVTRQVVQQLGSEKKEVFTWQVGFYEPCEALSNPSWVEESMFPYSPGNIEDENLAKGQAAIRCNFLNGGDGGHGLAAQLAAHLAKICPEVRSGGCSPGLLSSAEKWVERARSAGIIP